MTTTVIQTHEASMLVRTMVFYLVIARRKDSGEIKGYINNSVPFHHKRRMWAVCHREDEVRILNDTAPIKIDGAYPFASISDAKAALKSKSLQADMRCYMGASKGASKFIFEIEKRTLKVSHEELREIAFSTAPALIQLARSAE